MSRYRRLRAVLSLVLVITLTTSFVVPYGVYGAQRASNDSTDSSWPPSELRGLCDWFDLLPGLECDEESGQVLPDQALPPDIAEVDSTQIPSEIGVPDPDPGIPQTARTDVPNVATPEPVGGANTGVTLPDSPDAGVEEPLPDVPAEGTVIAQVNTPQVPLPADNEDPIPTVAPIVVATDERTPDAEVLPSIAAPTVVPTDEVISPITVPTEGPASPEPTQTDIDPVSTDISASLEPTETAIAQAPTSVVSPESTAISTTPAATSTPEPTTIPNSPIATPTALPTEVSGAESVIEDASVVIGTDGGALVTENGVLELSVSSGVLTEDVVFSLFPAEIPAGVQSPEGYEVALLPAFTINAQTVATGAVVEYFEPELIPYTYQDPEFPDAELVYHDVKPALILRLTVSPEQQGTFDPHNNMLFYLEESTQTWIAIPAPFDSETGQFVVELDHLTQFTFNSGEAGSPGTPTIVLDPDHGGANIGGHVDAPANWVGVEKTYNLATGLQTRDLLEQCGIEVIMTRDTDTAISLQQRADIINWYAPDTAVSIAYNILYPTMNASPYTGSGVETYRRSSDPHVTLGNQIAAAVSEQTLLPIRSQIAAENGDAAGFVAMMADSSIPYVHAELAFMDNYYDRTLMNDHPEWFAEALYNAIATDFLAVDDCSFIEPSPLRHTYKRVLGVPWWLPQYQGVIGADPVFLPAGNFVFQAQDFSITTPVNFSVERTYNSLDPFELGSLGAGWSINLDSFLYIDEEGVDWRLPDGQVYTFYPTASGPYESENGVFEELYPPGEGAEFGADSDEYVVRQMNETYWFFSEEGKLLRTIDRNGNQFVYEYADSGALDTIIDPVGREYLLETDEEGRYTSFTTPAGGVIEYRYDGNLLIEVVDADGRSIQYEYDDQNRLTSVIDGNGNVTVTNVYDDEGRVIEQMDAEGGITTIEYDGGVTTTTDPEGNVSSTEYDDLYRPLVITDADGHTTEFVYNDDYTLAEVHHPNGGVTKREYDDRGNMIAKTDPEGNTTQWSFDEIGDVVSETDALGQTTEFVRDDKGNMIAIIAPNGTQTQFEYNSRGQVIATTYADQSQSLIDYDDHGAIDQVTDPKGNVTRYTNDILGRMITLDPPTAAIATYTYDHGGNLLAVEDAFGHAIENTYDGAGNLVEVKDRMGNVWTYRYDEKNRLIEIADPLDVCITYTYNKVSDLLTEAVGECGGADQRVTTYTYNGVGYITSVTNPRGATTTYERNANGQVVTETNALGAATVYEYDLNGLLVQLATPLGDTYTWEYDVLKRVSAEINFRGFTTTYTYDLQTGDLLKVVEPEGTVWQYTYNDVGRPIQTVRPDGSVVTYVYDANGNLLEAQGPLDITLKREYDELNRLVALIDGEGYVTTYAYDAESRLIQITPPVGEAQIFAYNVNGELLAVKDSAGNARESYQRDPLGRVLQVTSLGGQQVTFEYNVWGNLVKKTDALGYSWQMTYDAGGLLLTSTDPEGYTTSYAYTLLGDLAQITEANGASTTFAYDALRRLITSTDQLGESTSFVYDPSDNLVQTTDALGNTTQYTFNGLELLTSVINARGYTSYYEYDKLARPVKTVDALDYERLLRYDAAGRLVERTDARGYKTTFTYDKNGNVVSSTNARGFTTEMAYDAVNRLIKTTDPLGHSTQYVYDGWGNLIEVVDALGNSTQYTYNDDHLLIATTNARGYTTQIQRDVMGRMIATIWANTGITRWALDGLGRAVSSVDPEGAKTEYRYDSVGNLVSTVDANGGVMTMTYDLRHDLVMTETAGGRVTQYEYDALRRIVSMTNPRGYETRYEFDEVGNLVATINALDGVWQYVYDPLNRLVSQQSPLGNTTQYTYDGENHLIATTLPEGQTITQSWDEIGNLITITNALDHSTNYVYDARSQLIEVIDALDKSAYFTYDPVMRTATKTDRNGNLTQYEYDEIGNLILVIDAIDGETTYTYDSMDNLATITDANGHLTQFAYDLVNRRVQEVNPIGSTWAYEYDGVGNQIVRIDANGTRTDYTYDPDNYLLWVNYSDETSRHYEYDPNGNLIKVEEFPGGVTTATYNPLDNLIATETIGRQFDGVTAYTYDADSRLIQTSYPDSSLVNYAYNKNGWLTHMSQPGGLTNYNYDDNGQIVDIYYPNQTHTQMAYDATGRITLYANRLSDGTHISTFEYTYNPVGNVIQAVEQRDEHKNALITRSFEYDALNRLVLADEVNAHDQGHNQLAEFVYDAVGNMLHMSTRAPNQGNTSNGNGPVWEVFYEYDDADCLLLQNDRDFTCDANGNRIREEGPGNGSKRPTETLVPDQGNDNPPDGQGNGDGQADRFITEYSYSPENELVTVTHRRLHGTGNQGNSGQGNDDPQPDQGSDDDHGHSDLFTEIVDLSNGENWLPVTSEADLGDSPWRAEVKYKGKITLEAAELDFDYGEGSPIDGWETDNFWLKWERTITVPENGIYRIEMAYNDHLQLVLDDETPYVDILWDDTPEFWGDTDFELTDDHETVILVTLTAGEHTLTANFEEETGEAYLHVSIEEADAASACDWTLEPNGAWSSTVGGAPGETCLLQYQGTVDLTGTTRPVLTFRDKWDFADGELAELQVKEPGDAQWVTVFTHDGDPAPNSSGWQKAWADLSNWIGKEIELRFVVDASDVTETGTGWQIRQLHLADWNIKPGEYYLEYVYDGLGRLVSSERVVDHRPHALPVVTGYLHMGLGYDVLVEAQSSPETSQVNLYWDSSRMISRHTVNGASAGAQQYTYYDKLGNVAAIVDSAGELGKAYRYSDYGQITHDLDLFKDKNDLASPELWGGHTYDLASDLTNYGSRWYDAATQRWMTSDSYRGTVNQPLTLNRQLYVLANPTTFADYYGYISLGLKVDFNGGINVSGHADLGFVKAEGSASVSYNDGKFKAAGDIQAEANILNQHVTLNAAGAIEASCGAGHGCYVEAGGKAEVTHNGKTIFKAEGSINAGYKVPPPPRFYFDNKLGWLKDQPEPNSIMDEVNGRFDAGQKRLDEWEVTPFENYLPLSLTDAKQCGFTAFGVEVNCSGLMGAGVTTFGNTVDAFRKSLPVIDYYDWGPYANFGDINKTFPEFPELDNFLGKVSDVAQYAGDALTVLEGLGWVVNDAIPAFQSINEGEMSYWSEETIANQDGVRIVRPVYNEAENDFRQDMKDAFHSGFGVIGGIIGGSAAGTACAPASVTGVGVVVTAGCAVGGGVVGGEIGGYVGDLAFDGVSRLSEALTGVSLQPGDDPRPQYDKIDAGLVEMDDGSTGIYMGEIKPGTYDIDNLTDPNSGVSCSYSDGMNAITCSPTF